MQKPTPLTRPFLDTVKDEIPNPRSPEGYKKTMEDAIAMVEINRSLSCIYYDKCLNRAAREGWRGFSCRGCEHHNPEL